MERWLRRSRRDTMGIHSIFFRILSHGHPHGEFDPPVSFPFDADAPTSSQDSQHESRTKPRNEGTLGGTDAPLWGKIASSKQSDRNCSKKKHHSVLVLTHMRSTPAHGSIESLTHHSWLSILEIVMQFPFIGSHTLESPPPRLSLSERRKTCPMIICESQEIEVECCLMYHRTQFTVVLFTLSQPKINGHWWKLAADLQHSGQNLCRQKLQLHRGQF
jgi:hypothetical protein